MKTGWYISGNEGWFWDGKNFTDHLDSEGFQFSCCDTQDENYEQEMSEKFAEAKNQLKNPFTNISGPYEFDEILEIIAG